MCSYKVFLCNCNCCPKVLLSLKGLPKSDMYIVVPGKQVTTDHFNTAVSPGGKCKSWTVDSGLDCGLDSWTEIWTRFWTNAEVDDDHFLSNIVRSS